MVLTEHPKSRYLLYVLRDSFSTMAKAGQCKASAIVFNSVINVPGVDTRSDAFQVCLEHRDGYSAEVFFPYELRDNGRIVFGPTFAQEGRREIFGDG